jgi:GNAT superfamily N-acetyltransferase
MHNFALKKADPVGSLPPPEAGDAAATGPVPNQGLKFGELSEDDFANFVNRHATSPEIGRIGTYLDDKDVGEDHGEPRLFGLTGCDGICGAVSCVLKENIRGAGQTCKLDAIVIDGRLRKRGLASALVARAFIDLAGEVALRIGRIYSYAVHPATVRLLSRLSFGDPPPVGAPISSVRFDEVPRERFLVTCRASFQGVVNQLELQCALCLSGDRRARPWCRPARS